MTTRLQRAIAAEHLLCPKCGRLLPAYEGMRKSHYGSKVCRRRQEERALLAQGRVPMAHLGTTRPSVVLVCKLLDIPYTLEDSELLPKPRVCASPEDAAVVAAVVAASYVMQISTPEAARRLKDERELLLEFDALRRLGAPLDVLRDKLQIINGPYNYNNPKYVTAILKQRAQAKKRK